jgi:hypothetical protein
MPCVQNNQPHTSSVEEQRSHKQRLANDETRRRSLCPRTIFERGSRQLAMLLLV